MGINLCLPGPHNKNNCSRQQMGINPCLLHLFKLGVVVVDNKWVLTHVYSAHDQKIKDICTNLMHNRRGNPSLVLVRLKSLKCSNMFHYQESGKRVGKTSLYTSWNPCHQDKLFVHCYFIICTS